MPNQGGTHEQHVKAGQQSHRNDDRDRQQQAEGGAGRQQGGDSSRDGTHEQHVKAGEQGHKNR